MHLRSFSALTHENYLHRKQQYGLRVEAMLRYMQPLKECRSHYISAYFGDSKVKDCGICDVCLSKKSTSLIEEEFKKIQQRIFHHIPENGIAVKELLEHLNGIKKEKALQVLEFLQGEKKLRSAVLEQ